MKEEQDLKTMVQQDILHCETVWKESSYDKDRLAELFQTMLVRYINVIDQFAEGMRVVSPYDTSAKTAENYRENITILLERLRAFYDNGCSNEGLWEYHSEWQDKNVGEFVLDFTKIRIELGMMAGICPTEREDIMEKLNEMEEICAAPVAMQKKWERLRGYVVWVSGKKAEIAIKILPLFLKMK